jgi:hypothetical protein
MLEALTPCEARSAPQFVTLDDPISQRPLMICCIEREFFASLTPRIKFFVAYHLSFKVTVVFGSLPIFRFSVGAVVVVAPRDSAREPFRHVATPPSHWH